MKKIINMMVLLLFCVTVFAQNTDTTAVAKADTIAPKKTTELPEVGITAKKPVYMTDGEKTMYNVSEDPAVQSGTAADALQNAPGVEVDVEGNITLRGVSSVQIWLNNRPANMNAEALKILLQQMPASDIEKIEVITNPSARYSAQGAGGIINIVTVSDIRKNSFLSFGAKGSSAPEAIPFLSYVYANKKFTISTYLQYWYSTSLHDRLSESAIYDDSGRLSSTDSSHSIRRFREDQTGLLLNASWTPDTANMVYFYGGFYPQLTHYNAVDTTFWTEYLYNPGDYSYYNMVHNKSGILSGFVGLWYEHKFNNKGHKLSTSAIYAGQGYRLSGDLQRDYLSPRLADRDWLQTNDYQYHRGNLSVDYTTILTTSSF